MTVVAAYLPNPLGAATARAAAIEAGRRGEPLVVINATSGAAVADRALATTEHLDQLKADLSAEGLEVRVQQVRRAPSAAEAVLDTVEREHASLLVIGLRPRTATAKYLMGSTAQTLLLRAPCQVLAVKVPE